MSNQPPPLPPRLPKKGRGFPGWPAVVLVLALVLVLVLGFAGFGVWRMSKSLQGILATPKRAVEAVIPEYEDLLGEELSGSGFHIEYGGRRYIVCSLHQFDGKQPAEMGALSFDEPIRVTGRVHVQKDVQVLTYQSPELDKLPPLSYAPAPAVQIGEPVVLIYNEEQIVGHVIARSDDRQKLRFFRAAEPFEATGCSGAPVLSGVTGKVIGVALTADRAENARTVGFELLDLPASLAAP